MANIDSAFNIDRLALDDLVLIVAGSIDPASVGYEAPIGSIYLSTSGAAYRKTGALDTNWNSLSSGGTSNHNDLLGIQGGASSDYYHLTNTQLTNTLNHISSTSNPHSTSISNLTDVVIATPTNRQFFMYETATSKWKNTTPTTNDISSSTDKRYVTDAQLVVIGNTSGTNSGDQTITLTGDVTGSGTGSFATTVATTALANKTFTGPITFNGQINVNDGNILNFNNTPGTDTIITVNALNISANELSFLDGVTSNIQTQLNAKGTGSVTTVSVTTANGVSGTVATATTTPAISLTLGAITPTSVNSVVLSGSSTPTLAVTGTSSISGTNTGNQSDATLTFTDITTNNSSTTLHGFLRKLSNVATQYMDGTGNWSVPAGGGGAGTRFSRSYTGAPVITTVLDAPFVLPFTDLVRADTNITYNATNKDFTFGGATAWYTVTVDYSLSQSAAQSIIVKWEIFLDAVVIASAFNFTKGNGEGTSVSLTAHVNIATGQVLTFRVTTGNSTLTSNKPNLTGPYGRINIVQG